MNSIQAIAKRVEELDLRPIKVKLMDPHSGEGWTEEYTDKVEIWYRRFLALSLKYPQKLLVVNDAVDTFWHYHILDTRKYADDCQQVFGHFLHHFPYFGMRGEEDARNLQKSFDDNAAIVKADRGPTNLRSNNANSSCESLFRRGPERIRPYEQDSSNYRCVLRDRLGDGQTLSGQRLECCRNLAQARHGLPGPAARGLGEPP